MSWYWKEINDTDSASDATKAAVGVSYFVAGVTGLLAILSLVYHKPIMGVTGYSVVDATLFAIIGWRIGKLSRPWTVVGLALYALETLVSLGSRGASFSLISIVFLLAYINALRGVFAFHRYAQAESPDSSQPSLG